MSDPIFLDANIFMYAAGKEHIYKQPCVQILQGVESQQIVGVANVEVLQELLYRYHHIPATREGHSTVPIDCRIPSHYPSYNIS